jgi:hypothetical protein
MLEMFLPVGGVLLSEGGIANGQEVFRVLLLGGLGKIEASREDRVVVDESGSRRAFQLPPPPKNRT